MTRVGFAPEQQQMTEQMVQKAIEIEVITPPPDYTYLWVSGVIVPVLLAAIGWWIAHKRKARR